MHADAAAPEPTSAGVSILGVRADAITIAEAIERIVAHASSALSPARYVVKPYVEFFANDTADVVDVLNGAWLSLPDGVALQWAAAYQQRRASMMALVSSLAEIVLRPSSLTNPLPERFAGATFTWPLLEACRDAGVSVFLVGSPKSQSIHATARHLTAAIPGLRISGTAPGRGREVEPARLAAAIAASRAGAVLVGIGFPRQELLISALAEQLDHGVLIGEGGTFDYREFGGAIPRAPAVIRRLGLEWLWRLLREPSRLRRQFAIPRFIWGVHRDAVRRRAVHPGR